MSNIRTVIEILKNAHQIGDLFTAKNLLMNEGIVCKPLEYAIRAYAQENVSAMSAFIIGPNPMEPKLSAIEELERMAALRGQ